MTSVIKQQKIFNLRHSLIGRMIGTSDDVFLAIKTIQGAHVFFGATLWFAKTVSL